ETEIVPQLLAATTGLVSRAGDLQRALAPRLRTASGPLIERAQAAMSEGRRRWTALPQRPRRIALGGGLLLLLLLLLFGLSGDAVERAVSGGDLKLARKELSKLPHGASRSYAEGLIE